MPAAWLMRLQLYSVGLLFVCMPDRYCVSVLRRAWRRLTAKTRASTSGPAS